ncbi:hypothetical protein P43SY_008961 [Pythium insidiosum]|uniref:Methyltransferase domain-containing protein n=1 Tax=Pythium insidiosum TaxID=114742 RepID=A0AAD5LPG6_PYTIN|nr:hypothetical protein P43SY_008961 [Pythium insidiosum]
MPVGGIPTLLLPTLVLVLLLAMSTTTAATEDALFRWIDAQEAHQERPWGRVLDAGTGRHSLRWLTALSAATEIVAVTGEAALAVELQAEFGAAAKAPLHVHAGNWVDDAFLQREQAQGFDVIVADYLVGSIDGFAPYYQDEIFSRLRRLVAPRGRLYVVGLEPLSTASAPSCCGAGAKLVQRMAQLRDASILLAGRRCYREFPLSWTRRQLEKSDWRVGDTLQLTNVYRRDTIVRQLEVARRQLKWFPDEALAGTMREAIDRFEKEVGDVLSATADGKIPFGFDYVVAAIARDGGGQCEAAKDVTSSVP